MHQRIGEIFQSHNLLNSEQIAVLLRQQQHSQSMLGQLAVDMGFLSEDNLVEVLSDIYDVELISLDFVYANQLALQLMTYEDASRLMAIPFYVDDHSIKVALEDPVNLEAIDFFYQKFPPPMNVKFFLAKRSEILHFLDLIKYRISQPENEPLLLLNKIIFDALESEASDIHFEPTENFVRVRIRVDGELQILQNIVLDMWNRIKARLKLIAKLNITENRRPQSGHTRIYLAGHAIDLRISTHPALYDENFVVRIFNLSNGIKPLAELGFVNDDLRWLQKIIRNPCGIFAIVGPTGSGKTTTLYSLLKEINTPSINIMTLEDPVEYSISGVKQLDLREEGLLSFSDGVRSILRQDPDVLLIGEIRDEATAASAIRASLTGRLVLTTIHASTPLEGIRRLMDFGISLSDLIPSLLGIFSQRLVRYQHKKGRFPLTEYMGFSAQLKDKVLKLKDITICKNEKTFHDSAKFAVENNLTSEKEIKRVLGDGYLQI